MPPRVSCRELIGREQELAGLRTALERAAHGTPVTVFVSGEAGVGKTRLVREFVERVLDGGTRVWSGSCAPLAEGLLPYAPIVEILRGVAAGMGPNRLRELAGPTADWLSLLVPGLATEPAAPEAGPAVGSELPRLHAAVMSLFERLGEDVTVLVLEDLHWADPSTCGLLALLIRGLRRGRLLLVCTVRDDELAPRHPLRSVFAELDRGGVDRMLLRRLDRTETAAQIAGILPGVPDRELADRVFARSGGNPFLVEELLAAGAAGAPLPQGLRDILLARARRLPAAAQRMLLAVALADRGADHALLSEVFGPAPGRALPGIRAAVDAHVLVVDGDRYAYRHALVAEAVIADALPGERIRLHRAFARAFAARVASVRTGTVARAPAAAVAAAYAEVAHHWFAAGDAGPALIAAVDAGLAAESACSLVEARGHFQRALELWWQAPEAGQLAAVDVVGLHQHAAQTAYLIGDLPDALDLVRLGIAHADAQHDRMRAGMLHERLGRYLLVSASAEQAAIAAYETAVALVPDTATQQRARVLAGLAGALMLATRYLESHRWVERALDAARRAGARGEESHALSTLGTDLTMLGEPDRGLPRLREALAIAEQVDNPDDLGRTYGLLAYALLSAGRFTEAAEVAQRGTDSCRRHGTERGYGAYLVGILLDALLWSGRWDEGRHRLHGVPQVQFHPVAHTYLCLAQTGFHTATGDHERAERCMDSARRALASGGYTDLRGQMHALQAELCLWRGEPRAASDWVAQALEFLVDSDHGLLIARLLAAASRAEADIAAGPGSPAADPTPLPDLADLVAGLPDRLALGPFAQAHHAVAEAEQSRIHGGDQGMAWALAASHWAQLGCPYPLGYTRYRQAEALLSTPNRRRPASRALAHAHAIATRLDAAPLRTAVERLARRARLDLAATPSTANGTVGSGDATALTAADRLAEVMLTRREEQVLGLLADGGTNRQIAKALFISHKTVNIHVSNILAKLNVPNRAAAAAVAHRQRLIGDPTASPDPSASPDPTARRRDEN